MNITDCNISNNMVADGGGIKVNKSNINLINSTISYNVAKYYGGALNGQISNVNIRNSTITNNIANHGGGAIYAYMGYASQLNQSMTIENSTISNNTAGYDGGAISLSDWSYSSNSIPLLTITNSTLSGNTANFGAAIYGTSSYNSFTISNSTISGNTASVNSGAIGAGNGLSINLLHATITNNQSPSGSETINSSGGSIAASNSIISGNIDADDFDEVLSQGHNILGTGSVPVSNATDIITTNPQLNPLADNGGSTLTHLPMSTSPAIDAGLSAMVVDQRGVSRPQGEAVDIGSVEVQGSGYTIGPAIIMYLLN